MTDTNSLNPFKEEDEGYLAAEAGRSLSENPYPGGTIRYDQWRRGWHISGWHVKRDTTHKEAAEGYLAAETGQSLSDNPYPPRTIRYEQWQRGWHFKHDEAQRAKRLGVEL